MDIINGNAEAEENVETEEKVEEVKKKTKVKWILLWMESIIC